MAGRIESLRKKYDGINEVLTPSSNRAQIIEELSNIFRSSHGQGVNSVQSVSGQLEKYRNNLHSRISHKELRAEIDEVVHSIQQKLEAEPGFLENSAAWIDANLRRAGKNALFPQTKEHHDNHGEK
jgi:hypothetical protein